MVGWRDEPEVVEVVWSGTMQREGTAKINLVGDRVTKPGDTWVSPARMYTRTGNHVGKGKKKALDNCPDGVETADSDGLKITTFGDEGE